MTITDATNAANWIDHLAAELLDVEHELRTLLRQAPSLAGDRAQHTAAAKNAARSIRITEQQARTLLRASMPSPIYCTRLRAPHARLMAALQLLSGHLLGLNDPLRDPAHAAGAGALLAEALGDWLKRMRWLQATRKAGVAWPYPVPITALLRQSTSGQAEQTGFAAFDQRAAMIAASEIAEPPARSRRRRAARAARTHQDWLQLAGAHERRSDAA